MTKKDPRRSKTPKPDAGEPRTYTEVLTSLGTNTEEFEGAVEHARELQGGTAETRVEKEFAPWIKKFANAIVETEKRTESWDRLKNAGDTRFLLFDLYRFTYFGDTDANALRDTCQRFKADIDKLITSHEKLAGSTSATLSDPKYQLLMTVSDGEKPLFMGTLRHLDNAIAELKIMSKWAQNIGSGKTDPHDSYLYSLVRDVQTANGSHMLTDVANLIEAGYSAHGARGEIVDSEKLKKRLQRYVKRYGMPPLT